MTFRVAFRHFFFFDLEFQMRSHQLIIAAVAALSVAGAATYALAQATPADNKAAQTGNTSNASNPGPMQRDGQTTMPAATGNTGSNAMGSSSMGSTPGTMQRATDGSTGATGSTGTTMGTTGTSGTSAERATRDGTTGATGATGTTSTSGTTGGMSNGADMRTSPDAPMTTSERAARADRN
jgi:hypothetical protein